ncbi:MAG TPA: RNA polymerase sigma-70 factor [Bacteroidales bacterium]
MSFDFNFYWQKTREGDEKAFEILFKEINNSLCYYAFQITNDRFIAQEIVQDVFLKIWQNRRKIIINGSFKAYLYLMTHNLAINTLLKINTRKNSVSRLVSNDLWENFKDTLAINPYLLEQLEAEETDKTIEKAIDGLPQQCKDVFSLSRFENKSYKEISSLLNITESTVRSHIFKALEKIEEVLKKNK